MKRIKEYLNKNNLHPTIDNITWVAQEMGIKLYLIKTLTDVNILTTKSINNYNEIVTIDEGLVSGNLWSENITLNPVHVVGCVEYSSYNPFNTGRWVAVE